MAEILDKLPESAILAENIINEDGSIDARFLARALGAVVTEVLSGRMQASRAHAGIRGMHALVTLADAVRRSSDSAQPLLQVTKSPLALPEGVEH